MATRKTDSLYLNLNNKDLHIEFEEFDDVMWTVKRWFHEWKKTTTKPARSESLEDFLIDQEAFLKREYGEERFAVALEYLFLSSIFQIAIQTAAENPKRLQKLFMAMKAAQRKPTPAA